MTKRADLLLGVCCGIRRPSARHCIDDALKFADNGDFSL